MKPTKQMIEAATEVFKAKTIVANMEKEISPIQCGILAEMSAKPIDGYDFEHPVILEHKYAYLMNDDDFNSYYKQLKTAYVAAGIVDADHDADSCPLAIAQNAERIATDTLVELMKPITGIDLQTLKFNMKAYEKYVDLTLQYVAPHTNF